jgi:hypothetical protein
VTRSHLVAYLLIAASLGFLGGVLFERGGSPGAVASPEPIVAKEGPGAAAPPPSETSLDRFHRAEAAADWPAAVAAIEELAKSPETLPQALGLLFRMMAVDDIVEYAVREEAMAPLADELAFHRYGLAHAREVDEFAAELYLPLACEWMVKAGEGAHLVKALSTMPEGDQVSVLRALEGHVAADMVEPLAAFARASGSPGVQSAVVRTIATAGVSAEPVLGSLADSTNPWLAESAELALLAIKPPATGWLVIMVSRDARRPAERMNPLKRGDLITHVGGKAIESEKSFRDLVQAQGARGPLAFKVVREGEVVELKYPSAFGPPRGVFVRVAK